MTSFSSSSSTGGITSSSSSSSTGRVREQANAHPQQIVYAVITARRCDEIEKLCEVSLARGNFAEVAQCLLQKVAAREACALSGGRTKGAGIARHETFTTTVRDFTRLEEAGGGGFGSQPRGGLSSSTEAGSTAAHGGFLAGGGKELQVTDVVVDDGTPVGRKSTPVGGKQQPPPSGVGSGASSVAARPLLESSSPSGSPRRRMTYLYGDGDYVFHLMLQDCDGQQAVFLCLAHRGAGRRVPFAFLDALANECEHQAQILHPEQVRALLSKYNSSDADTLKRIRAEICNLQELMVENIDKILVRGEKIELLVEKTEGMSDAALVFRREAAALQRVMWWRNCRVAAKIAAIIVALIFLLLWSHCGVTFQHC
ncbi:unnamed protein product [Amoebophrya sp. A25]|nr:unnamed protein product [Amoebophrya sp. A25]|eukprot:GSA25T00010922001.1